jgi:hypothetical protein
VHPSFGRRIFQPLFERDVVAGLVCILVGVGPNIGGDHGVYVLGTFESQNLERRGSASVYVQGLETGPTQKVTRVFCPLRIKVW